MVLDGCVVGQVEVRRPELPGGRADRCGLALPEAYDGYLRVLRQGEPDTAQADQDPAAVVFGLGYGPVHESLPFAAAVLGAARHSRTVPVPVPAIATGRRDPADIAERIRHLGELHSSGLVTDDEFSAKKAELLAEL